VSIIKIVNDVIQNRNYENDEAWEIMFREYKGWEN
jgi:hypothetical protein